MKAKLFITSLLISNQIMAFNPFKKRDNTLLSMNIGTYQYSSNNSNELDKSGGLVGLAVGMETFISYGILRLSAGVDFVNVSGDQDLWTQEVNDLLFNINSGYIYQFTENHSLYSGLRIDIAKHPILSYQDVNGYGIIGNLDFGYQFNTKLYERDIQLSAKVKRSIINSENDHTSLYGSLTYYFGGEKSSPIYRANKALKKEKQYLSENLIIQFSPESSALKTSEIKKLDLFISDISKLKDQFEIVVEGHADISGDSTINEALSKERAKTILEYLDYRLSPVSVSLKHFGADSPLHSNDTAENRAKNRRAKVYLIRK